MEKGKMTLPFALLGEDYELMIDYGEITSPEKIGFEVSKSDVFDIRSGLGFPFMRARVESLQKNSYRNLVAFIQTTTSKYFEQVDDMMVALNEKAVDIPPFLREKGFPFYAFGYPSELFSARFSDLQAFTKLSREINTFLVTFPNPANDNTVSCLAAFSWGFVEWVDKCKHQVKLLPFKKLDFEYWNYSLEILEREFGSFQYARSGRERNTP
jgi:hypothetical protein